MSTPQIQSSSIIAPRNNVEQLKRIDATVSAHLEKMVRSAESIRNAAAYIVVAGVQMIEIVNSDLAAWEEFAGSLKISARGDGRGYREVAHAMFRHFTTEAQGDGSLARRTISRDRVCRYSAAIMIAHGWFREGCTDPEKLAERIVKNGGVWALAKLRAEQREMERRTLTKPAANPNGMPLKLELKRPSKPVLFLVLPDGSHHLVPPELAHPVIARMVN